MSPKSDKLAQRIQDIQKFALVRSDRDAIYPAIVRELGKLSDSLKTGKLNIQIYSRFPILAQALQNCLCDRANLSDFYQFQTANLPTQPQPSAPTSPAALILQSSTIGQQPTRYPLSTTQKTVMGRRPGCTIQIPDHYTKVSGNHVEIEPLSGTPFPTWRITDKSVNGTYINGRKLEGNQILQPGDRITLAYASTNEKAVEFIFESQASADLESEDEVTKQLADCDILCLVFNPSQLISAEEKEFLEKASKSSHISRFILVADTSGSSGQITPKITTNFTEVKNQLSRQVAFVSLELFPLLLRPFYPNNQAIAVEPSFQTQIDKFCESLEAVAKGRVEEILMKRITAQLLPQIAKIERVINLQESALIREIQKTEEELQQGGQSELKEQTRKALKKANDEKDKFFKQAKIELNQSKNDLLDGLRKSSILYKIQSFTENLKPVVIKKGDNSYIQLYSESTTNAGGVANAITHLCRSELFQWGTEEWRRICSTYAEGGLSTLLQRLYTTLNVIPSFRLSDSLRQYSQNIDIEKNLQSSVAELTTDNRYQATSLPSYLFKNFKGNIIGITGVFAFLANTFTYAFAGDKNAGLKQGIAVLTVMILPFVFVFMIYDYQKDKALKLEEEGEKVKEKLRNHYKDLAKRDVDRLVQTFSMKLDAEERRLREAIETVNEQFIAYFLELEKVQVNIKSRLSDYKTRQNELKKEKAELEKFKLI